MERKKALVIGATGLVGSQLVELLLGDNRFIQVVVFTRRPLSLNDPKLVVHIVDFDQPEKWDHLLTGDILFSAMGTTIKKAGSKENQYRIDYLYQYQAARNALSNGVHCLVLVSSAGANPTSAIFYSRMKGELERDIKELGFAKLVILQPSFLDGARIEKRVAEQISLKVMRAIKYIPIVKKYRPIHASIVARAMINKGLDNSEGNAVLALDAIFEAAQ